MTKAIADVNIYPMGTKNIHISPHIVKCVECFQERGLKANVHAAGTNIEGDLDTIMESVKEALLRLLAEGVPRLDASVRIMLRSDKEVSIDDMVQSVHSKMQEQQKSHGSQGHERYELRGK